MAQDFFDKVLEFFRWNIGIFQEKISEKLAKKDKSVWLQMNARGAINDFEQLFQCQAVLTSVPLKNIQRLSMRQKVPCSKPYFNFMGAYKHSLI